MSERAENINSFVAVFAHSRVSVVNRESCSCTERNSENPTRLSSRNIFSAMTRLSSGLCLPERIGNDIGKEGIYLFFYWIIIVLIEVNGYISSKRQRIIHILIYIRIYFPPTYFNDVDEKSWIARFSECAFLPFFLFFSFSLSVTMGTVILMIVA